MKKIEEITRKIAPSKNAIFVDGDPGIVSLQESMKTASNSVFARFRLEGTIYSCMVETKDELETRGMLLSIPIEFKKEGVEVLTVLKAPLDRISLFPFFSILEKGELKEPIRKLKEQYWARFKDDVEALHNWYSDLVRFRREIVTGEVPRLEPAVPAWMGHLRVYVLYNERDRVIATRYYRSAEKEDTVSVKETSETLGFKGEAVFSKLFSLPPMKTMLSDTAYFSQEGEKVYLNWEHPYISASEELRKQVERFNRVQRRTYFDAYRISSSLIDNWTRQEILKLRELITEFPLFTEKLKHWLQPLHVVVLYFVDDPVESKRTDGMITGCYMPGTSDKILVERMDTRDGVMRLFASPDLAQQYFPDSGKPIFGFTSGLIHYLGGKLGEN